MNKKKIVFWTDEDVEILKNMYEKESEESILDSLTLDRSWTSVMAKAESLGIKRRFGKILWDENMLNSLKRHYPKSAWDKIFSEIGVYDKQKVMKKASKMGIKRIVYKEKEYSQKEDGYIKANYSHSNAEKIARFLARSKSSVISRASKIGASKDIFVWKNMADNEILSLLKKTYDDLGRKPMWRELTSLGLPSGSIIKTRFGGLDEAFVFLGIESEGNSVYGNGGTAMDGSWCNSQSEIVVTNFLYAHNIEYRKEVYYREIFSSIKTHKSMDWLLSDGTIVEFFGLTGKKKYDKKTEWKKSFLKKNNAKFIPIYPEELNDVDLNRLFKKYI